jgi:hypothetical protein
LAVHIISGGDDAETRRSTYPPKPKRSSNSRTRTNPPSEVTLEPRKATFLELLRES